MLVHTSNIADILVSWVSCNFDLFIKIHVGLIFFELLCNKLFYFQFNNLKSNHCEHLCCPVLLSLFMFIPSISFHFHTMLITTNVQGLWISTRSLIHNPMKCLTMSRTFSTPVLVKLFWPTVLHSVIRGRIENHEEVNMNIHWMKIINSLFTIFGRSMPLAVQRSAQARELPKPGVINMFYSKNVHVLKWL